MPPRPRSTRLLATALGGTNPERTAVVLPPLRQSGAPGHVGGDRCHVQGLGTAALARADTALVAARTSDSSVAFAVETSLLQTRPLHGLDPALGWSKSRANSTPPACQCQSTGWPRSRWPQLALGHGLVGAGRAMLELAQVHALERMQFGRPIGTFQAVRHRLAESLVALEAAAALFEAAWDDPAPVTAAMAKSFAGRSARTAARHCQQVLAGIGFTTEHPLHLFIRRTIVLDQLLGAGSVLTRQLGTDVLRTAALPPPSLSDRVGRAASRPFDYADGTF